ncbi:MAG: ankyrin repeat domain-containing protein [Akkermansiaceae bacterium]|nr:ankyrin repeat domain-containing protein [Akkermansiaceae bacterium]
MKPVEEKRIHLALYEAAGHPDGAEDVRRFIAAGADVKRMKYILHRAVRYGSTEIVRLLLEHGARVDTHGSFDCTPLHNAAHFMRHECIPLLLAAGADVNALSSHFGTPLECAASPIEKVTAAERFRCMKQLMKAGAILREQELRIAELLCKAVEENELSIVDELLEMGVPPDTCSYHDERPIYTAVFFEQYACMERLFAAGADIHRIIRNNTLMHTVIGFHLNVAVAEWLLEHGFNPDAKDADGTPCLHEAARRGRPDIMQRLIAAGADVHSVTADGSTLLHAAVEGKQIDTLQLALSLGLNVNAKNKSGHTPLHLAAADDLEEMVRLLLSAGANVNAKAKKGATPLACVDRVGFTTVRQLVEAGAETSSDAEQNVLCRTFIVSAKNADELAMLLELIDLTRRDASGNTPMHRWLADCQPEPQSMRHFFPKLQRLFYEHTMAAFLFLSERGVNFNLINNDGQSVLDLAAQHANAHVNRALRKAGAKYGYELGSPGERKLMESILSSIRPIDLPEPEEWHSVDDVLAYARLCTTICGLTNWQWTVEKMGSDCLGFCCHHTETMKLTPKLLDKGQLEIRNVIIQELAHALAGPGHGRDLVWRLWCSALGLQAVRLQNVPADEETKLAGVPTQEETPQIVSVEPPRTTHVLCHRETGEVFRRFTKLPRYTAEALAKMTIRGREDETRGQLCVVEMPKEGDRYTGFVVLDKNLCLCSDCFYRDLDSNEIIEARLYKGLRRVHYLFLPHRIVGFAPAANKRRPAQTSTPEPTATRA